jgi:hypothetical protein
MRNFIIWDVIPCHPFKETYASEEYVVSILRVEGLAKQETNLKQFLVAWFTPVLCLVYF